MLDDGAREFDFAVEFNDGRFLDLDDQRLGFKTPIQQAPITLGIDEAMQAIAAFAERLPIRRLSHRVDFERPLEAAMTRAICFDGAQDKDRLLLIRRHLLSLFCYCPLRVRRGVSSS